MDKDLLEFEKKYNILEHFPVEHKKRGHGEGSITKIGDKWHGRFTIGKNSDGKQVRKRITAKTKSELMEKMRNAVANFKPEEYILIDRSPTLYSWLLTYIRTYKNKSAPATIKRLTSISNALNNAEIGSKTLNSVSSIELQEYINSLNSFEMTKKNIGFIREAYAMAVNNEICKKNPALFLVNQKEKTAPKFRDGGKAFTIDEEKRFVNYIKDNKYRILYLIILYSGLRRGEVCALTKEDIALKDKKIHVRSAARRSTKGGYEDGKTKTQNAIRSVPMQSIMYDILSKETLEDGYLVKSSEGKMLNPDILTMDFAEIMKDLNMDHTLYHLRHTYGTRLHAKGIDDKVTALFMGHSSEKVTQEHYIHATPDMIEDAIKKL